ncbi:hypothetical protein Hneap_0813 [Halothiobacillus neapolitanus c2]|uniref:Uncharacterized protein n=1 Tax=Halothiobacillus neapolitanus (strain ATCC 23641 / DSM 15147 / CIP 104769 / NCIMB 8539 / c2) TaxID=555778 RepID=D0KYY7_HALNC|nr:hypothetical protein Hneap_0813 [Halothiobacillus neapolitanus c2]
MKRNSPSIHLHPGSSKNPSLPRRRESSALIYLGFRFRGNDESRVFRGVRPMFHFIFVVNIALSQ